ncbi:MAG: glycerol-3-phosphate acyltransferase PlsX [Myxococcota bacterium]|jgi:glycerol-3-phosphate acyltransferase PlsX
MATIAIDTLGGLKAPEAPIAAAGAVSRQKDGTVVILVGDPASIQNQLSRVSYNPERIRIHPAGGPTPEHSVRAAAKLVADNKADALVTAGDPPLALRACFETFNLLKGVHRAPLAAVYPTLPRPGNRDRLALILDVGTTFRPTAEDLAVWARMGAAYAGCISQVDAPTVGLLSVGRGPLHGTREIIDAHRILSAETSVRFVGNVESADIPRGAADVIVCDGFTGQVVVGLLGAVGDSVKQVARGAWEQSATWRMGLRLLEGAVVKFSELLDHEHYGGAPLLGFDRTAILALPNAGEEALTNAIRLAAKAARRDVLTAIRKSVGA